LTLHEKLAEGRARLTSASFTAAEAAADVDYFARTILDWDGVRLIVEQHAPMPAALEPAFSEWVGRRMQREPAAYIVGNREFWSLDFLVSPAVLIPRPETEFIVDEALNILGTMTAASVADIGTGSGCLAVSIAHAAPHVHVVASDLSAEALEVASANAARHAVSERVRFVHTSYLEGVFDQFDLIVANPPYVRDIDRPALAHDVRHEPDVALFGGHDGLRDVEGVIDTAVSSLKTGGWLLMEFGYGQEDDVRRLIDARSTMRVERIRDDLQGIARTAIIQRQ
jgi:release factor glutamine methyltransferase